MVEPPLDAGAVKATLADWVPAVAVPIVGAPGTVAGMLTLVDAADAELVRPAVFVTVIVQV